MSEPTQQYGAALPVTFELMFFGAVHIIYTRFQDQVDRIASHFESHLALISDVRLEEGRLVFVI
jgi:TRAP-type C4-dicarboxylate transport system permease small subunit